MSTPPPMPQKPAHPAVVLTGKALVTAPTPQTVAAAQEWKRISKVYMR